MLVGKFISDFRQIVGDGTENGTLDAPDDFLIAVLNKALRELPLNPKLSKLFTQHYFANLDAKRHWKFDLGSVQLEDENGNKMPKFFDRILDLEYLHFWTSTGGDPCPLKLCQVTNSELYGGGIPHLMKAGKPCKYTLERDGDKLFLVLDRPSDVPIILDYIAYGIPREVTSEEDDVPITKLCENAIIDLCRSFWYEEAEDLGFARSVFEYLDNKTIPQLVQEINKKMQCEAPRVLGN